jgi:ADP-dependent NAD(P)H-hydrate dehydratase / NAD(P)H-hydrate epimerase
VKVLTAAQMREVDRLTTERYCIPSLQLMENAGSAVAAFLRETLSGLTRRKIVVLCGKGNNGGDGFVAARFLKEAGCSPDVFLFGDPNLMQGDAATNMTRWQSTSGTLQIIARAQEWEIARKKVDAADVIVDALLGTGLRGPVEGLLAIAIEGVNDARQRRSRTAKGLLVLAVDIPSGLGSDDLDYGGPAVIADYTVTFTAPKVGQLVSPRAANCGILTVRAIGTPPEVIESDPGIKLRWLEPGEFRSLPLARDPVSNKGSYGHALIVAGSLGKSGAAILGARSALRSGAGLVTVATPSPVLPVVASGMPEMMTEPLLPTEAGTASLRNLDYGRITEIMARKSVLAIGPGMTTQSETQQFIRTVVQKASLPVILDADGLNAFAGETSSMVHREGLAMAITPHPGEMARLLGCTVKEVQDRRLHTALESAAKWNTFVVLKGFHTIVASPTGGAYINTTGNPGMATGGTGDVLTGILTGLTAQFGVADWMRVIGLGVYLHGLAGDIAASRVGEAPLIASDVIEAIPEAYARILSEWQNCG